MKIALDAMGGDFAPLAVVNGAILAASEVEPNTQIILIGQEEVVKPLLEQKVNLPDNLEFMHAPEAIGMAEHPLKAFTQKKYSSISVGYSLLKDKKVEAFCSAGNTGAMLIGAVYSIKLEGLSRPAIMSYVPKTKGGHAIMLDVGANTDCKPETLQQFGEIGSVFFRQLYQIEKPRVALISVGEEEEKGNLASQTAYKLMKENSRINFVGNIEGRDLFKDIADVYVCDGFVGNIIIKMAESYYEILKKKNFTDPFFDNFNFELIGGSPVLGIDGTVIIGHGISNPQAIKSMVLLAQRMVKADIQSKIKEVL
ncbi:MAG: phosphate acyltransferase PlsX [Microscillaceae bacterium]|nr:phosphate acyltransferase PlsX [Microscillaceae bacterium]